MTSSSWQSVFLTNLQRPHIAATEASVSQWNWIQPVNLHTHTSISNHIARGKKQTIAALFGKSKRTRSVQSDFFFKIILECKNVGNSFLMRFRFPNQITQSTVVCLILGQSGRRWTVFFRHLFLPAQVSHYWRTFYFPTGHCPTVCQPAQENETRWYNRKNIIPIISNMICKPEMKQWKNVYYKYATFHFQVYDRGMREYPFFWIMIFNYMTMMIEVCSSGKCY